MTPTIEIGDSIWHADSPLTICRGEGAGILERVPAGHGFDEFVAESDRRGARLGQKRIFVCDSPTTSLRRLVRSAAGFVFRGGTGLCHFGRIVRAEELPACIDRRLWQRASDAVDQSNETLSARLVCGHPVLMTDERKDRCLSELNRYHERLRGHSCSMPVYDVSVGRVLPYGGAVDLKWGEKALSVNAIRAEKFSTANSLLLINPAARAGFHEDPHLTSLLEQVFPQFGAGANCELMVRASLHSTAPSQASLSGLVKSPAVKSRSELARAIENQVSRWKGVRVDGGELSLAIAVQERIQAKATGVLSTGRPWDCSAEGVVVALTPTERGRAESAWYHMSRSEPEGLVRIQSLDHRGRRLIDRFEPALPSVFASDLLSARFAQFLADALDLRSRYTAPLEIEFVLTEAWDFKLVQFRPLF